MRMNSSFLGGPTDTVKLQDSRHPSWKSIPPRQAWHLSLVQACFSASVLGLSVRAVTEAQLLGLSSRQLWTRSVEVEADVDDEAAACGFIKSTRDKLAVSWAYTTQWSLAPEAGGRQDK